MVTRVPATLGSGQGRAVDDKGKATQALVNQVDQLINRIFDLETRLEAAEATIADHETRITALEP